MKLQEKTIEVLNNFSSINKSVVIKADEPLKTISETKSVMATYSDVSFDEDFAIYDLSNFLGVLKVYKEPELKFSDKFVSISGKESKSKIKYYFADPDCIISPTKDPEIPSVALEFDLSADHLASIKNVANILSLPDFFIKADGEKMEFGLVDEENSTSNSHIIDAGKSDKTFEIYFKEENLKLLPLDYKVTISDENEQGMRLASFFNKKEKVNYFIVPEATSNFGE